MSHIGLMEKIILSPGGLMVILSLALGLSFGLGVSPAPSFFESLIAGLILGSIVGLSVGIAITRKEKRSYLTFIFFYVIAITASVPFSFSLPVPSRVAGIAFGHGFSLGCLFLGFTLSEILIWLKLKLARLKTLI